MNKKLETKSITLELLPESDGGKAGGVSALFSKMNVVDHDGDVTLPGAFKNGERVRIAAYGHKLSELPVGDGAITADADSAKMVGEFYTETTHGMDTYLTVKRQSAAGLQEWSYEYDVLDSEPGTHKGQKVRFLKSLKVHGVTPVYLGAGIGTQTLDIKSLNFSEHGGAIVAEVRAFVERAKWVDDTRAKEGRTLSGSNRERLGQLRDALRSVDEEITELLDSTDAGKARENLEKLRNAFLRNEAILNGTISA